MAIRAKRIADLPLSKLYTKAQWLSNYATSNHVQTPDKSESGSSTTMVELKTPQSCVLYGVAVPRAPEICHFLNLPIEIIESICRQYIDITTATCLGLTCKSFFNITEHLYPFQINLHMRTKGTDRKCLGHLLTSWMAPKYSFDHSWGKFLLKRYGRKDEDIDNKWREKEGWTRIGLQRDRLGACIAYKCAKGGF